MVTIGDGHWRWWSPLVMVTSGCDCHWCSDGHLFSNSHLFSESHLFSDGHLCRSDHFNNSKTPGNI